MNITKRRYKILVDFTRVYSFLEETYDPNTLNSYLLPQYFEYAHMHPAFDYFKTHHIGVWENDGDIVGIACFEMGMGDCHMHVKKGFEALLPELLSWSENEMSVIKDGKHRLGIWITDKEFDKIELLQLNGYTLAHSEPVNIFDFSKPFVESVLPEGFSLIDGTDVNYVKLRHCFWKGFDHGDNPDDDGDGNSFMCNAPHADMSLMTIAVAPDGEYACALGMWFDEKNKYAYLEPLATIPKYRRMGLATAALTEAMKKTKSLGAKYCFGGAGKFYTAIGFETICNRELWKKEW